MSSIIDNKYVIFKLGKEYYGIPISKVVSIERMEKSTRIPNGPSHVKGVINLRGEVITLVDLRQKLSMESKEVDGNTRIIVVSEEEVVAGLIVDSSSEVVDIHRDDIDNPPIASETEDLSYIYGIGKIADRVVILLDLSRIFEY